jgi:hypothetical protein
MERWQVMFEEQNDFTDRLFCDPPQERRYPSLYMIGIACHRAGLAGLIGASIAALEPIVIEALERMASK